jgi:hypothetical protein
MATYRSKNSSRNRTSNNRNSSSGKISSSTAKRIQSQINQAASAIGVKLNKNRDGSYSTTETGGGLIGARRGYRPTTPQNETINSASLAQTSPIQLPSYPQSKDYSALIQGNNAGLATLGGLVMGENGQISVPPLHTETGRQTTPVVPTGDTGVQGRFQNLIATLGLMPQKGSIYEDPEYLKQQRLVERSRKDLNNYTANLNAIMVGAQQQQLALENQGRGITTDILDTQSYEISRRAAIAALPVQAQIATAQGNLDLAERNLDQVYRIKSEQLSNEYEYKVNQFNSIKEFLTKEEDRRLAQLDLAESRKYQEGLSNIQMQDEWAKTALANGHPELISSIHGLDPKSATFRQQLAKIQGRMGATGGGEIPTIKSINGVDYQWDPITQKFVKPDVPAGGSSMPGFDTGKTFEESQMEFQNLDQAFDSIRAIAADYDKDVFQLDLADIKKFSNADMDTVGKSLAIIQNPALEKTGSDPGNALEATGFFGKVGQSLRRTFAGKKYTASDVYDAILQARKQYKQKVAKFGYAVTPEGELVPIIQ